MFNATIFDFSLVVRKVFDIISLSSYIYNSGGNGMGYLFFLGIQAWGWYLKKQILGIAIQEQVGCQMGFVQVF